MSIQDASGLRLAIDTNTEALGRTTPGSEAHARLAETIAELWGKYKLAVAFNDNGAAGEGGDGA